MSPQEILDLVDLRYLSDFMSTEDALAVLQKAESGKPARMQKLRESGYMAYTTSPGWLGYSDEKLARLSREAIDDGFEQIKLKVGGNRDDDIRRLRIARDICAPDFPIAIAASQHCDAGVVVDCLSEFAEFVLRFVDALPSPVVVLAHAHIRNHISPTPLASGELCQYCIVF